MYPTWHTKGNSLTRNTRTTGGPCSLSLTAGVHMHRESKRTQRALHNINLVSETASLRTKLRTARPPLLQVLRCAYTLEALPQSRHDVDTHLNRGAKTTPLLVARRLRAGSIDTSGTEGVLVSVPLVPSGAARAPGAASSSPAHNQDRA